jgi:hypothetical protein
VSHYDYRCDYCQHTFELNVPITDRDKACDEPCPQCNGIPDMPHTPTVERLAAAPGVGYTIKGARARTPEAFKDVLRNIKANHRGSTIDV